MVGFNRNVSARVAFSGPVANRRLFRFCGGLRAKDATMVGSRAQRAGKLHIDNMID